MPPPTWLIQDILPAGGLAALYGPPGSGKTFVALDLALSVAAGTTWQGKATQGGLVLYVSAEGTAGLGKRIRAWLVTNDQEADDLDIGWVTEGLPVYAGSADLDTLFARFEELDRHPTLIILDTLQRCFEGNENETQDMGAFVSGCDRLRRDCKATVLVVHHSNADGIRERGNTALRAGSDTMICCTPGLVGEIDDQRTQRMRIQPTKGVFSLRCEKQKDAADFNVGVGRLVPVEGTASCAISVEWLDDEEGQ